MIAGAGPAGSTVAERMASKGLRVLLLEEHPEIGVPLHCSGLVSPRTLDVAGVSRDIVLHEVWGARVYAPSGRSLTLGDGTPRALVIDRVALDRTLADRAQKAGAALALGTKVTALERSGGTLRVAVEDRGGRHVVGTRLLIGADGAHSRVARLAGLEGATDTVAGLGVEGEMGGVELGCVKVFVGRDLAPGWFGWIIPVGSGRARVGIGSSNGVKPVQCFQQLQATFPEQFASWSPERWSGGTIPLWSRRTIIGDNVMLVGDAAGQVKPTSGGGIYSSLVGGRLAADVADEALAVGDVSKRTLARYSRAWERVFGTEFRRGQDLRRVFLSLDDTELDRLLALFGRRRLQGLINRHGDIDFPGRLFSAMVRAAPFLWLFVRRPLSYWPLWR